MKLNQSLCLIGVFIITLGCIDNKPIAEKNLTGENFTTFQIDLKRNQDYLNFSNYFTVHRYELPAQQFGTIHSVIPLTGDRFIIVEKYDGRITFFSGKNIEWRLTPGEGPGKYDRFHKVYYDSENEEVVICQDFNQLIYSTDGKYLRKTQPVVAYNDLVVHKGINWYSSNGHDNSHMSDNSRSHGLYAITQNNSKGFLPENKNNRSTPYTDGTDFFQVAGTGLMFHQNFHDTIYRLDPVGETIHPDHVIRFKDRPSTQQTLTNAKPPSIARYVASEQLPYAKFSTPLSSGAHLTVFYSGTEFGIFLKNDDQQKNAKKIMIDGVLYNIPYLHDNGSFSYATTPQEHEQLQELLNPAVDYEEWRSRHQNWNENRNDDEPVYLFVLMPK